MKRNQSKEHKRCIFDSENEVKNTHRCLPESPIFRNSNIDFLDLECHPLNPNTHKPFAIECEVSSDKPQRQKNYEDLLEWKRRFPEGEIFQLNSSSELDTSKLRKTTFPKKTQFPRKNQFNWANMNKKRRTRYFH